MTEDRLTVADFFCGAGGFSEGFRQMGFDVVFALDNWEPAIETHKMNHPDCENVLMDIKDIETGEDIDEIVPDVDVIIGGPPCVNFSMSNKAGKADKTEGLNLIECYLRIIAWKMEHGDLKYWILENVPNTKNYIKDRYTWDELQLPGSGPDLEVERKPILTAADFGAPQERDRMFAGNYPKPSPTHNKEEWKTVKDVFQSLCNPLRPDEAPDTIDDPNYGINVGKDELTDHFYDTRVEEYRWKRAKRLKVDHGFMGKMSFPEDIDRPSRTVMATRSASTREAMIFEARNDSDREEYRLPTVREIACFMSYPITYQFEGSTEAKKYRLVGNSVPTKVARALAKSIAYKEGIETPDEFLSLPESEPSLDLTGQKRDFRSPRKRREDSKFARHVPFMKVRAFRPELTNQDSDFSEDDIKWTAVLHKGVGKSPSTTVIDRETVEKVIHDRYGVQETLEGPSQSVDVEDRFEEFKDEIKDRFEGKLPDAGDFQKIYTRRLESDKLGPNDALEEIKDVLDKYFPESDFERFHVDNSDKKIDVSDDEIPLRILVSYWGVKYLCDSVNGNRD